MKPSAESPHRRTRAWACRTLRVLGSSIGLAISAHIGVRVFSRMTPPTVEIPREGTWTAWTAERAGVKAIYLEGPSEAIGAGHSRLLRAAMIADEEQLWKNYERLVPWSLARVTIEDISLFRYRSLDRNLPDAMRRELAAQSLAMQPDPLAWHFDTYQRLVFLHALYDVALAFEHSPLIGCTSFALGPSRTVDGHILAARAFDFEGGEVFDRDKAVLLVRGQDAIPYASVAWPGFVGVLTGMNADGVFAVVHGARAGSARVDGMPAGASVRQVLERAHDVREAIDVLRRQDVMVSHIVFLADASGQFAVVERAPGVAPTVRERHDSMSVTNEFEGSLALDPNNLRVHRETTSSARGRRIAALLASVNPGSADPHMALDFLRDHSCADDPACPLGDRRAIDALIATHGVVADLTSRSLWVSAGPHLSGHFVRFDLATWFEPRHDPSTDGPPDTLPEDPILRDGRFASERARATEDRRSSP